MRGMALLGRGMSFGWAGERARHGYKEEWFGAWDFGVPFFWFYVFDLNYIWKFDILILDHCSAVEIYRKLFL